MIVYKAEQEIADKVRSYNTFACYGLAEKLELEKIDDEALQKAAASLQCQVPFTQDLFSLSAIMLSSVINDNGDAFSQHELLRTAPSAVFKPVNLEHDPKDIRGSIVSAFVLDGISGNRVNLEDPVDDLGEVIHLAVNAIIYKHPAHDDLKAAAELLIKDIENRDIFVSMETVFTDFNFLMFDGSNRDPQNIVEIERNAETAFLTKHLKLFGGAGEYGGKSLARILNNTTLVGLGLVKRPGNPDSIIFDSKDLGKFAMSTKKFSKNLTSSNQSGVYIDKGENSHDTETEMSVHLEKENKELKDKVEVLTATIDELKEQHKESNIELLEKQVAELKQELNKSQADVVDLQKKIDQGIEAVEKLEAAKACMCKQYDQTVEENKTLQEKLNEMEADKATRSRLNVFLRKGYSEDDAKAAVEELKDATDDLFEVIIKRYPDKSTSQANDKVEQTDEVDVELETTQASTKVQSTVASDDTEKTKWDELKAGIVAQMAKSLKQKSNSEEK